MESTQTKVQPAKKPYTAPKLSSYGDVGTITGKFMGVTDLNEQKVTPPGLGDS